MASAPPAGGRSTVSRNGPPLGAAPPGSSRATTRVLSHRRRPHHQTRVGRRHLDRDDDLERGRMRAQRREQVERPAGDGSGLSDPAEIEQRLDLAQDLVARRLDVDDAGARLPGERPAEPSSSSSALPRTAFSGVRRSSAQARPVRSQQGRGPA